MAQAVFYLVATGYEDLDAISDLLYPFSENVIAKAIDSLVNAGLLSVNLIARNLKLSTSVQRLLHIAGGEDRELVVSEEMLWDEGRLPIIRRDMVSAVLTDLDVADDPRDFGRLAQALELVFIQEEAP